VTLRGRLTTAFLAVVLGPVLLGAVFVSGTVTAVSQSRSTERLNLAATAVRTSISALCRQLEAAAGAVALLPEPAQLAAVADQVVARGLASAVRVTEPGGDPILTTSGAPPLPWTRCDGPARGTVGTGAGGAIPAAPAVTAEVELRDPGGTLIGRVAAAQLLDTAFVARLAAATGVAVTLMTDASSTRVAHSTESVADRDGVVAAAARLSGERTSWTAGGRYVRRVGPDPGQPLPLVLSTPGDGPPGLYTALITAVVLAGLLAVLAAWWLARSTIRPLAELARAANRVVDGDLTARVPVHGSDEVSRLASTFNRMTREAQSYVHALTVSRDQLRSQLTILGDTLSSTHDLQRILRVILQTALAATGAPAGAVLLLDPAAGMLVGQSTAGTTPGTTPGPSARAPSVDDLQVPVGSGLLGGVALSGQPRRGRVDRDGPVLSLYEPQCRTYVVVPFSVPGWSGEVGPAGPDAPSAGTVRPGAGGRRPAVLPAAFGVLAVYDRLGGDEFEDADLITLRTFAGQAAVAVNNVRIHKEAERLSVTDPLTGLGNYRHLRESIRREIERANRFGRMLAVLALDLDRFKDVNDTYGHAAGDSVLVEFARRIRVEVREVDLAFRQGGEEFVVLLPETDVRGGAIVAERLNAAIRNTPVTVGPHAGAATRTPAEIVVTVSIGIAVYPDDATTGEEVLDAADDALYAAKAAGRDTFRTAAGGPTGEMSVAADAADPEAGHPATGGASFGPRPPRQSRGR